MYFFTTFIISRYTNYLEKLRTVLCPGHALLTTDDPSANFPWLLCCEFDYILQPPVLTYHKWCS